MPPLKLAEPKKRKKKKKEEITLGSKYGEIEKKKKRKDKVL